MNAPCRYILGFRVIVGVLGLAVGSANLAHAQGEDAACDEMLARYSILLEQAQFADALDVAQEREGECPSEDSSFMVGLALANLLEHKLLTADRQTAALDEALRRLKRAVDAPLTKEDWRQTAADWVEFLQNMQPDPPPDTAQAPAAPAAGTATLDAAAVPPALPPALPLAVGEPLDTPGGATGEVGAAASEDGPVVDISAVAEDAAAPTAPAAPAELAPSPETAALAAPAATAREQRPAEPAAEERSTSALGPTLVGAGGLLLLGSAGVVGLLGNQKDKAYIDKVKPLCNPDGCAPEAAGIDNRAQSYYSASYILLGVGASAALSALIWYAMLSDRDDSAPQVAAELAPGMARLVAAASF